MGIRKTGEGILEDTDINKTLTELPIHIHSIKTTGKKLFLGGIGFNLQGPIKKISDFNIPQSTE